MDDITTKALKTFTENLKYLEQNNKELFERVNLLNLLIDEEKYSEKYALEYKEEGYFDILEIATNEFLYKTDSIEHAKNMVEFNNRTRQGGIFKGLKHVHIPDMQVPLIDQSELSFHNSLWGTAKVINYCDKYTPTDATMKRVNKLIFLEIGLGLHLQGIIDKLNARVIFIKEKNLETFRLSLFVTNYNTLAAKSNLHFSITDDELKERENFLKFLNEGNNYNLIMKHIPFNDDYKLQTQRLQSHVISQNYINYGYSAILLRYINSPRYLVKNYSYINVNNRYNDNILSKKPVLLLFSGPSTTKNIEWIKANHHRFIIISALSTCRLLHSINITPDIVIHIDPDKQTKLLFEDLNEDYFNDTLILLASNVDEDTVAKFKKEKIHFIEQGTDYKKGFGKFSSPSVGEYTYGLSLILGVTTMYMLGIDLALDRETLQTHSGDFHPFQSTAQENDNSASLSLNKTTTYVKGNFHDEVPTLTPYKMSIEQLGTFSEVLKKDHHKLYNLSDGAYLQGCTPLHIQDYNWQELASINKEQVHQQINTFLDEISSSEFRVEDRAIIEYQIKQSKKLEKTIKLHTKKKFTSVGEYLNALAKLSWNLSDMEYKMRSDLAQVYYEYFPITLSFIFDMFNTEELVDEKTRIKEIDEILIAQLRKMSTLHISTLQSYLK